MNRAASRFLALVLLALGLPVRTDGFTASPAPERCWFMDDFESGKLDAWQFPYAEDSNIPGGRGDGPQCPRYTILRAPRPLELSGL